METIRLFLSIVAATAIGWCVLSALTRRSAGEFSVPEKLSISYGLGLGCVSLEMLLFYFLNIPFGLLALLLPFVLLFALSVRRGVRPEPGSSGPSGEPEAPVRLRAIDIFLISGISFEVLYAFFRALIKPLEAYDAVAIYGIKAKIFYLAGSIPLDYLGSLRDILPHPDYPLHIPLTETFLYIGMGTLNDQLVKAIFPLYFLGLIGLMYCGIRRFAGSRYALLFTFIMAGIPHLNNYAANGYVDIVLAYYVFAGYLYLFIWLDRKQDISFLLVSAAMMALAGWTKNEGLVYCASAVLIICISTLRRSGRPGKAAIKELFSYAGIIAIAALPWLLLKHFLNIQNRETGLEGFSIQRFFQFGKIRPIAYEFQKEFFNPKKWNIFWPAALIAIAFNLKRAFSATRKYMALAVILAIAGYVIVYFASPLSTGYLVSKTWNRFLLHFLPVMVYWVAWILREEFPL
ncbi:hypothetical protein ACFL3N_00490 [Candidatus Omnitrophota bacterium]